VDAINNVEGNKQGAELDLRESGSPLEQLANFTKGKSNCKLAVGRGGVKHAQASVGYAKPRNQKPKFAAMQMT
jgi:hypothetical protein